MAYGRERLIQPRSSAGFARATGSGGGFGGGRRGPLRRSGMGEHVVVVYGKEPA
jgi:hypothetical protein